MTDNAINIRETRNSIDTRHKDFYWLTPSKSLRHKTSVFIQEVIMKTYRGWFAQKTDIESFFLSERFYTNVGERNVKHVENKYPMNKKGKLKEDLYWFIEIRPSND